MSGRRDKALAVLGAIVFTVALPAACLALRSVGPAAHVVFYDYLPIVEVAMYGFAALLGAALGVDARVWLGWLRRRSARPRLLRTRLAALAVLALWVLVPQLRAFPAYASIAERDAWARDNVREYPGLKRIVATAPEVQRDVGRVIAIAPTSKDEHRFAREMDGDDLIFTLDVIGEKGAGTFHADCTLEGPSILDWRSGRWLFGGHETRIDRVAVSR